MLVMNRFSADPEAELREVFNVFDINKDGFITTEELYEILVRLGESITKVKYKALIVKYLVNRL